MLPARPQLELMPIRTAISCTAIISGKVKGIVQSIELPVLAPAIEYVAIPDGSSSEAPVTKPGPNRCQNFFSFLKTLDIDIIIIGFKVNTQLALLTQECQLIKLPI